MPIDLFTENVISLAEAAATLPRRPSISTLHRWRLRGVRGVLLETVLVGGRRCTSREALSRFIKKTTLAAEPKRRTAPVTSRSSCARDHQRNPIIEAKLDAAGIGRPSDYRDSDIGDSR